MQVEEWLCRDNLDELAEFHGKALESAIEGHADLWIDSQPKFSSKIRVWIGVGGD